MTRTLTFRNALLALTALTLALGALALGLPASALAAANAPAGQVDADLLNLRTGPGFQYAVLRLLKRDQALTLLGRSANSLWLEVRAGEAGGWVYAGFVRTGAALDKLPVTEAAGGPANPANPSATSATYPLSMSINDNVATVTLQRYPANAEVLVRLSRADGSGGLLLAQGATDASGAAQFTFPMPRQWSDGRNVTENALTLTAAAADGKFSRTASIQYYR